MPQKSTGEALRSVFGPFAKLLTCLIAFGCVVALGMGIISVPTVFGRMLYDRNDQENAVKVTVYDIGGKCMVTPPGSRFGTYDREVAIAACARKFPSKFTFIPESYEFHKAMVADPNPVFVPHRRMLGDSRLVFVGPGGALFGVNRVVPKLETPWGRLGPVGVPIRVH